MRRALIAAAAACVGVVVLAACSVSVRGTASAADPTRSASATGSPPHGQLPGGAQPSCPGDDGCQQSGATPDPAGLPCSPLPAAMSDFDTRARSALGGPVRAPATSAEEAALTDLVLGVVDACGYQVMVDVADQYSDPLYTWLRDTAVSALGEVAALPEGLRCADLQALGLGPKQDVDYWFLWGGPGLMDADSNGIPCETVWPDVGRYMPANY